MAEDLRLEGKTVEEAIQKAATILEVLPQDLIVEIIDTGSQGFLGINRRAAVIMARRAEETPVEEGSPQEAVRAPTDCLNISGDSDLEEETAAKEQGQCLVRIKDGKIYVDGNGLPAAIICGNHFELFVNGQAVTGEVAVRGGDRAVVKPEAQTVDSSWKLTLSPDGLRAKLALKPAYRHTWKLKDHLPTARLVLEGELLEEALPAFTREQLEAELNRHQITYGIDLEAIQKACTATEPLELVVARGKLPQPGEDARVECLFSADEITRVEIGDEERVNYREMVVRASVTVGTLLAVKVPPRAGVPGIAVTGKPVAPPEPLDVELVAGKGTEVIDGQRCVARIEGRPQSRRRRRKVFIDVLPVFFHPGDVNLESGNLKFKGSINISGSVNDTMEVVATQDLEVGGDVTRATVSAGGSIVVRNNCIGSSLSAGGASSTFQSAEPILSDLFDNLSLLKGAVQQLARSASRQLGPAAQVDMGYLFNILVENKFRKIPQLVTSLEKISDDLGAEAEEHKLASLAQELHRVFSNPAVIQTLNMDAMDDYLSELKEIASYCQGIPQGKGNITLNYSLNSKLRASGQVKILGKGCFNTEIKAGARVEIWGVFRGGSIYAANDVYLQEMGSPGGARTLVRVAAGRHIKVVKIWPNSILQIGKRITSIDTERDRILAYLDSENNLVLGGF